MLEHEQAAWSEGIVRVAGVDEAGRGPLAGPVVAAAVVFDPEYLQREQHGDLQLLTDSKKVTPKRRAFFFELLTSSSAVTIGVAEVSAAEIDQINILKATHRAMARALAQVASELALVDGLPVPGLPCPSRAIVKGDSQSLSIAAASIIAKVTRDRMMQVLHEEYPAYGFARHKGYGTAAHLTALREHGATPHHRQSFAPVRAVVDKLL